MTTYMTFESALHILTVAHVVPLSLLILASGIGLAVIETLEEAGEL
jgi:hypothetical protein